MFLGVTCKKSPIVLFMILQVTPKNIGDPASGYASILGIPTLQTGVFGGIIISCYTITAS
jgi:phosphotransferase system  glucose/maltose/N-acetylglucosamine-specific IIC component